MTVVSFSGTPVIVDVKGPAPYSVAVFPGAGCTCRVEFSLAPTGTRFFPWEAGDVTAATGRTILSRIRRLRFTRVSGAVASEGEIN